MAHVEGSGPDGDSRFRLAMERAGVGMALVAADGMFLNVNGALCAILGRDADALMSSTWQELTHPADLAVDLHLVSEVLSGARETYRLRKRFLRPDGSVVWGDLSVAAMRDAAGGVDYFISQIVDVTEQVRIEDHFRLLAENASDVVIRNSADGTVEWISPSVTELLGWVPEDVIGHPIFDLAHPDDLPSVLAGQPRIERGETVEFETRVRTSAGDYRWISARVKPILDSSGALVGRVAGWRDIEAEHAVREAARTAEQRYRLLAENASDVVYLVGPERLVTWISPNVSLTLGWAPTELLGTSMYELIHPEDRSRIDALREAVFSGRGIDNPPEGYPSRFRRKDGSYVWMSLKTTTITGPDGAMTSAVTGMRDVDALITARQQAEADEARLQSLLDGMLEPFVLLAADRNAEGAVVDFTFADANPAALAVYQMSREELLGSRLSVLHPAAMTTDLFAMYVAVVEDGTPMILDDWAYPQDIFGGRVLRYDVRAFRAGDAVSQIWRDVTERYEAGTRLAASEEQFRLLAENSTDIVLHARGGIMQWLSPSLTDALGWNPSDWVGHPFEEFTHPDDVPLAVQRRAEITAGASAVTTLRMRDARGVYHWVEVHAGPYSGPGGQQAGIAASLRLIDDDVASRQALAAAEEHYRLLAENSTDVVAHARDGRIIWISPSITGTLGGTPADWVGRALADILHPDDVPSGWMSKPWQADTITGISRVRVYAHDGTIHWIDAHTGPFRNADGTEDGLIASFRIVDDIVAAEQELDYRARFDTLTGLMNRTQVLHRLSEITTSTRKPGIHTAVLFCDIDNFKDINDTHGHATGDQVLRTLADRITGAIRSDDAAARIGGDELLIILGGIHTLDEATSIAEKLRLLSATGIETPVGTITATLSIGVTLHHDGEDTDHLIARADQAMYAAKRNGRNQIIAIP